MTRMISRKFGVPLILGTASGNAVIMSAFDVVWTEGAMFSWEPCPVCWMSIGSCRRKASCSCLSLLREVVSSTETY